MMKYTIFIISLMFLNLTTETVLSQNNSGLQFLSIGPDAYSLSISEAHTAVELGSSSIFSNPANLMLSTQSSLSASHTLWIGDTQHTQASASILRENDAFAIGILSSSIDDITVRSVPGPSEGSFSVRYLSLTGGYARQISFLSVGASVSYLYEQFFQTDATGYGFSAGITGEFLDKRLRVASAITNAGKMDKLIARRSDLPTIWRTGLDVSAIQLSAFSGAEIPVIIKVSADVVVPINEETDDTEASLIQSGEYFALGIDAQLYDIISVRGGYRTGETARAWSFGAGINIAPVKFNYAFIPFETGFGMVHSISMQYFFDF